MPTLGWVLIAVAVCWYLWGRHHGDLTSARQEALDRFNELKARVEPQARERWEWVKSNRVRVLIMLVVGYFVFSFLWPNPVAENGVALGWGPNNVEDACGNTVEVWVVEEYTELANTRIEIVPGTTQSVTLLKPGADARCAEIMPLTR